MGNGKSVLLIGLILLVFACGCAKPVYQLPQSWPVQQLTLPPGSVIVMKPIVMHELSASWTDKSWSVYFDCSSGNLAAMVAHVESCLKPLSYNEFWMVNPRLGNTRTFMGYRYFSPDGKTEVHIQEGTKQPSAPTGNPAASEYIVSITITPAPAKEISRAGRTSDNGVTAYLEPIK